MAYKPVVLAILDGWGLSGATRANAPRLAATPNFDRLMAERPAAHLSASGTDVGLPEGQMGNSEVGHTNIGAGRVVWMDLPRIDRAIETGDFARNAALDRFAASLRRTGGTAHLLGLMSPGGVHSHQRHLAVAANHLAALGIPVALHLFLDGRDTPPRSAQRYLAALREEAAPAFAAGARIASVMGRFYALDRDNRWQRVSTAFAALVGRGEAGAGSAEQVVEAAYARGETDEFVTPVVLPDHPGMRDGDGLFCLNFRADRAREILSALVDPGFDAFDVAARPDFAARLGMVAYSDRLAGLMDAVFPPQRIENTLGAWVAAQGRRQFRLAETEKYPHVTFFLNGGVETPAGGEDRYMAPSPPVRTYDMAPAMAAAEVSAQLAAAIRARYDLIVVNFANPDMVGHTGDLDAAIRACEAVDRGLGLALDALAETGGAMIVTADHGNCEVMVDPETGGPHTAHTTNPVPVVLVECGARRAFRRIVPGRLADLAPSLLELMGLEQPPEMTGRSLLRRDAA